MQEAVKVMEDVEETLRRAGWEGKATQHGQSISRGAERGECRPWVTEAHGWGGGAHGETGRRTA